MRESVYEGMGKGLEYGEQDNNKLQDNQERRQAIRII